MEDIKGLIEKIQQEGVEAAEKKAGKIEEEAKKAAVDIVRRAKQEAEKIIKDAKEAASQTQEVTHASLKQAGRDLLLSLKKEINVLLEKIVIQELRHALNAEELSKIIANMLKNCGHKEGGHIEIALSKADLKRIEDKFLSQLKEEIKNGVILKPVDDIAAGFIISYDGGKSYFDFTDKALADYITKYLRPQLTEILK